MNTNMIERLQKISADIFQQSLKTYKLKDIIVHKRAHALNLVQNCSLYPNKGIGFKARRKTWADGMYIMIKNSKYKSNRFGTLYGIKYIKNEPFNSFPVNLQGCNKRGVWEYDLGDFKSYETDNGIKYTRQDYEQFYNMRKQNRSMKQQNTEVQQTSEEVGQQQNQQSQQEK